jgi:hypothetical protein
MNLKKTIESAHPRPKIFFRNRLTGALTYIMGKCLEDYIVLDNYKVLRTWRKRIHAMLASTREGPDFLLCMVTQPGHS